MSEPLIYLASPYSHADPAVRAARFDAVCVAAGGLLAAGRLIYAPIAHSHPIALSAGLGTCAATWRRLNHRMMRACDELWILTLPGWKASTGVAEERLWAVEQDMPILYTKGGCR